jgi:hypothetical protein
MNTYLPKCTRATDEIASCADWCYGVPDAEPPDHVCYEVFLGSIEHYVAAHLGLDELHVSRSSTWPTPMGVQELRTWYEEQEARRDRQFPYVSTEFHQRWNEVFGTAPPPLQHDERLKMFDDFPPEQVAAVQRWWREGLAESRVPPVWGAPPVSVPGGEYWLGFVVRRPVDNNTLWLLGLLGRPTAAEFDGNNWFKWIHPVLQIESSAVEARKLNAINKQSKQLLRWYNKRVLGKTAREGRPVGSKEHWRDRDDFLTAVRAAKNAIERRGQNVTQARVVEYLSVQRTSVTRPHADSHGYTERQFRRDRQDFDFYTWEALKEFLKD